MPVNQQAMRGDTPRRRDDDRWSLLVAGDFAGPALGAEDRPVGADLAAAVDDADLALVNLEAPLRGDGEPIAKSGPVLHSTPATPAALADAGFDGVTLATNHTMDYGAAGMRATVAACEDAGLATVGVGADSEAATTPLVRDVGDVRVAVCNLCEREFGVATATDPGTAWVGAPEATAQIWAARDRADVVVVVAHGGVEFAPLPPAAHRDRLRRYADLGADLVVGHHPHVPQGAEVYADTPIHYSVGNFRFEMQGRPRTAVGYCPVATFEGSRLVDQHRLPVETTDGVVDVLPEGGRRGDLETYLDRASAVVADDETFTAHWQEVADRLFRRRYTAWLRRAVGASAGAVVRDPALLVDPDRIWDAAERRESLLVLLNLVRNESHRDLLETALAVRAGVATDHRTPTVRRTCRDLFRHTTSESPYDAPSFTRRLAVRAVSRLPGAGLLLRDR